MKRFSVAWTLLFAAIIFNAGAFVLTVHMLQIGFIEMNPLPAFVYGAFGVIGLLVWLVVAHICVCCFKVWHDRKLLVLSLSRAKYIGVWSAFPIFTAVDFFWDFFMLLEWGVMA